MQANRLSAFLGRPVKFNGVDIYSPTVGEVEEIGEVKYNVMIAFASFDKETILIDLLKIPDSEYEEIEDIDSFDILIGHPSIVDEIIESISFFSGKKVSFDSKLKEFYIENKSNNIYFLSKRNYKDFSILIKTLNGMEDEEELKFKNERVKQKYKKIMKQKKKIKSESKNGIELKDVLSILCNSGDNGINIFNVGNMTIYQVYEHFERVNIKENHKRMLAVWANTYSIKEGTKLAEWIVRTKL